MYISSSIVKPYSLNRSKLINCYPHGFDCLSIIVPRSIYQVSIFKQLICHVFTLAVLLVFGVFVLFRFIIFKEKWSHACMATLSMFFVQHFDRVQMKLSERILTLSMLVFILFSTTVLSSMLFKSLFKDPVMEEIDNLDELAASGLTVCVNEPSEEGIFQSKWNAIHLINLQFEFFFSTPIKSQVQYMSAVDMGISIITDRNTSNAYVLRLSRARFTLSIADYVAQQDGSSNFRVMKEPLSITINNIITQCPLKLYTYYRM